jgi:hypothetical protein
MSIQSTNIQFHYCTVELDAYVGNSSVSKSRLLKETIQAILNDAKSSNKFHYIDRKENTKSKDKRVLVNIGVRFIGRGSRAPEELGK